MPLIINEIELLIPAKIRFYTGKQTQEKPVAPKAAWLRGEGKQE